MFGSVILDVAIGLLFVYWLLSLICSALGEAISARLNLRAKGLEKSIRQILADPSGNTFAKTFFNHPLVKGLSQGAPPEKSPASSEPTKERAAEKPTPIPSYIPARAFALTIFDLLAPATPTEPITAKRLQDAIHAAASNSAASTDADAAAKANVAKALSPIVDHADGDLEKMRTMTEDWFNQSMDRLSGWYKRHMQFILRMIAVFVVLFTNADTLMVIDKLSRNQALRDSVVKQAAHELQKDTNSQKEKARLSGDDPPEPYGEGYLEQQVQKADGRVRELNRQLESLNLLGWTWDKDPTLGARQTLYKGFGGSPGAVVQKIIGFMLTVLAVSLGAPFWFELMNKLVNLRSTGPKPAADNNEKKQN